MLKALITTKEEGFYIKGFKVKSWKNLPGSLLQASLVYRVIDVA